MRWGERLALLIARCDQRDAELAADHDLSRLSFTEQRTPTPNPGQNCGVPLPDLHFSLRDFTKELPRRDHGKVRIISQRFHTCYCGAEVQKSNWVKHLNLNATYIPEAGGCSDLPGPTSPLFKLISAAKTFPCAVLNELEDGDRSRHHLCDAAHASVLGDNQTLSRLPSGCSTNASRDISCSTKT